MRQILVFTILVFFIFTVPAAATGKGSGSFSTQNNSTLQGD